MAETEKFLDQISENMEPKGLPDEYYQSCLKYLDTEYKYGTKHVINLDGFYPVLKPKQKLCLVHFVL